MQILSDQPDDLLVGLVQLHTAAAGVFPIVLAVDDATAAAVIVDNEAVVFGVVSVRGGAAARWILITDADAVIATASIASHVLGTAAGIECGTLEGPGARAARRGTGALHGCLGALCTAATTIAWSFVAVYRFVVPSARICGCCRAALCRTG